MRQTPKSAFPLTNLLVAFGGGRARLVIDELRIDEALWATASPARRAEWRGAIRDFVDENDFEHDGDTDVAARGAVALAADRIVIALEPRPTVMLDRGALQPIIDEYLQICSDLETIAEGLASPASRRSISPSASSMTMRQGRFSDSLARSPSPTRARAGCLR